MEIGRFFGLPAHPLIVHAVVVLVPLCSLGVAVSALWPAARWRLAWVLLGLTIIIVAMVPLATGSGEALEEMVKENGLVERHAELEAVMNSIRSGLGMRETEIAREPSRP